MAATSGPLEIDYVSIAGGGRIGMVHCPGRNHVDDKGRKWTRDLAADMDAIRSWPAAILISLIEPHEFAALGATGLGETAKAIGLTWYHMPIRDMHAPAEFFELCWPDVFNQVSSKLTQKQNIVLHCAGGFGRTGTVAARILMQHGSSLQDAVQAVRNARPRAIETTKQETYLAGLYQVPPGADPSQ